MNFESTGQYEKAKNKVFPPKTIRYTPSLLSKIKPCGARAPSVRWIDIFRKNGILARKQRGDFPFFLTRRIVMSNLISVRDYIWDATKFPVKPVTVLFGNDPFLKMTAFQAFRHHVLKSDDAEFSLNRYEGDSLSFKDLLQDLTTAALFGESLRLVVVDDADKFITKNRDKLEQYVDKPSKSSLLLLETDSFPATTHLYKKVSQTGFLIEAQAVSDRELPQWVMQWSQKMHNTACEKAAAEQLVELIGAEHGLLDQELAKLALMVPPKGKITADIVAKSVGSWRTRNAFEMIDLALNGKTAEAIGQLDKLLSSGEKPAGILPPISASLRRFGAATQKIIEAEKRGTKISVKSALAAAGVNTYFIDKSEQQLMRLTRHRGKKLIQWLLQADLDLKGGSRLDPRTVLETLIIRIADGRRQTADNRR